MREFVVLAKAEMVNWLGRNVYRHTKDPAERKRRTLLRATIAFLLVVALGYVAGGAYGLSALHVGSYIPTLYTIVAAMVVLLVGLITVRGNLYREKDREMLSALPVRGFPIAAARLFHMYLNGVVAAAVVLVPSYVVYAVCEKPGAAFYPCAALSLLVIPILPTAIAAWVGILVTAILSRMRHKVLAEVLLAILAVVGLFVLPAVLSGGKLSSLSSLNLSGGGKTNAELTEEISKAMADVMEKLETSVPGLSTWGKTVRGNAVGMALFGLLSLVVFLLTALVIGRNFFSITAKLAPAAVHREYRMERLSSRSAMSALVRKEAKRYFSSGVYVSNTIIGAVLTVVIAVALAFVSPSELLAKAGNIPVNINADAVLPFLFGMCICMMSITASALSMEGKNWWIVKSLPVDGRSILGAKILFDLCIWAPFYAVTEIVLLFTFRTTVAGRILLLLLPAAYIVFAAVWGMFCNVHFPKFHWENATEAVKQSAAAGLAIAGVLTAVIPGVAVCLLPEAYVTPVSAGVLAVLLLVTALLYGRVAKTNLLDMN